MTASADASARLSNPARSFLGPAIPVAPAGWRLLLALLNMIGLMVFSAVATLLLLGFAFIGDAPRERQAHFVTWFLIVATGGAVGALASARILLSLFRDRRWLWGLQLVCVALLMLWVLAVPSDMR